MSILQKLGNPEFIAKRFVNGQAMHQLIGGLVNMHLAQVVTVTGGTADTAFLVSKLNELFPDDYFNDHFVAWVLSSTEAANLNNKYLITDYTSDPAEFTSTGDANWTADDIVAIVPRILFPEGGGIDLTDIIDALHGAAGIASFPSAAKAANGVSMAEVIRHSNEGLRPGDLFITTSSVTHIAIVNGGTAVFAGPSSAGDLYIENIILRNDATAMDSAGDAAVLEIFSDNVNGSGVIMSEIEANLGANVVIDLAKATTGIKNVLESTKSLKIRASVEDFTSGGTLKVDAIWRRGAANATIQAV